MVVSGVNGKGGASIIGKSLPLLSALGFLLIQVCRLPKSVGELLREGGKTVPLTVNSLNGSIFSK